MVDVVGNQNQPHWWSCLASKKQTNTHILAGVTCVLVSAVSGWTWGRVNQIWTELLWRLVSPPERILQFTLWDRTRVFPLHQINNHQFRIRENYLVASDMVWIGACNCCWPWNLWCLSTWSWTSEVNVEEPEWGLIHFEGNPHSVETFEGLHRWRGLHQTEVKICTCAQSILSRMPGTLLLHKFFSPRQECQSRWSDQHVQPPVLFQKIKHTDMKKKH